MSADIIDLQAARLDRCESKLRAMLVEVDELRAQIVAAIAAQEGRARLEIVRDE